jgi:hypothetical protein
LVIYTINNLDKYEGYAANLTIYNYKNNLQEAILKELSHMISSGYIYSDIDSACQHPILHLILTIINMEREQFKREAVAATNTNTSYIKDIPVICYYSNGCSVLMNN